MEWHGDGGARRKGEWDRERERKRESGHRTELVQRSRLGSHKFLASWRPNDNVVETGLWIANEARAKRREGQQKRCTHSGTLSPFASLSLASKSYGEQHGRALLLVCLHHVLRRIADEFQVRHAPACCPCDRRDLSREFVGKARRVQATGCCVAGLAVVVAAFLFPAGGPC